MPRGSATPAITSVAVKNFQPNSGLSHETLAFSASIYINGRRVGEVSNGGTGGCNVYDFGDPAIEAAFMEYARVWGEENGWPIEAEDGLVEQLCEDYEYRRLARSAIAAVATALLLICKQPVWFRGAARTDKPSHYEECYVVGLMDGEHPADVAQREGAVAWRIVPVEVA